MFAKKMIWICFFSIILLLSEQSLIFSLPGYRTISYMVFILMLFLTIKNKDFSSFIRGKNRNIFIIIYIFFIWKMVVLFYTPYFEQGIKHILDFTMFIFTSLIIVPAWFKREEFLKLLFYSILFICLFSIIGSNFIENEDIYTRIKDGEIQYRYTWLFIHPNLAGLFGLTIFMISIMLFDINKKKIYLVIAFASFLLPYLAQSRTNIILMCSFLALYLYSKLPIFKIGVLRFLILILTSSIVIIIILTNLDFFTYENINKLLSTRLNIWSNVIGSMENKIIGEGLFQPGVNLVYSREEDGFGLDGLFINIFYDEGIIGILLFTIFLCLTFYIIATSKSKYKHITFYALSIAIFYSFTESHFFINNVFTVFILSYVSFILCKEKEEENKEN